MISIPEESPDMWEIPLAADSQAGGARLSGEGIHGTCPGPAQEQAGGGFGLF